MSVLSQTDIRLKSMQRKGGVVLFQGAQGQSILTAQHVRHHAYVAVVALALLHAAEPAPLSCTPWVGTGGGAREARLPTKKECGAARKRMDMPVLARCVGHFSHGPSLTTRVVEANGAPLHACMQHCHA